MPQRGIGIPHGEQVLLRIIDPVLNYPLDQRGIQVPRDDIPFGFLLVGVGRLPGVRRAAAAKAELLLQLPQHLDRVLLVDPQRQFPVQPGVDGLDDPAETQHHRLRFGGHRVERSHHGIAD